MAMQAPDFTNPQSWAWNATLDREIAGATHAQVSYVGRSASHLERARNINQLQPGTVQANPGINANALRPYKGFGPITQYETTGRSRYNGLQTQVERRSMRGVGFSVAYTFSRTKDDGSGRGDVLPNAFDETGYYGISDLDRPHVLVTQYRYRFPTLDSRPAALRYVLGDWDLSGTFQAQSGTPFDVRTTVDIAGVGAGSGQQFYNMVGDPQAGRVAWDGTKAVWFDKNAFQAPATGTFGVQRQNPLRYPGFWDVNTALRKSFRTFGGQRFEYRLEAFNVFNHPRLNDQVVGNNVSNPNSGDFGLITSKTGNRTVQMALQYVF